LPIIPLKPSPYGFGPAFSAQLEKSAVSDLMARARRKTGEHDQAGFILPEVYDIVISAGLD